MAKTKVKNNDTAANASASKPSSGPPPTRCATTWTPPSTSTSSSGLIFLKYISDAFEEQHAELEAAAWRRAPIPKTPTSTAPSTSSGCPKEARWSHLKANAKQPTIGKLVDDAMVAIERDNPSLKGVLPKDYARPGLDKQRLGQLIDLVSDIGLGDAAEPRPRTSWAGVRVLPRPVRQRRRQEGRPVLHARAASSACWSRCSRRTRAASTTPAAARAACSSQSEKFVEAHGGQDRRHLDLRAGVEPHHLAAGQDEPGHPRHRRQIWRRTATPSTTTCTPT